VEAAGVFGSAIKAEHQAWRSHFDAYPDERADYEKHFEQFMAHWRRQR
jgi:hypothetical protein